MKSSLVKSRLLALAFATSIAMPLAASDRDPGRDGPVLQGISLNGPLLQGLTLNGPVLQGLTLNGPILQGLTLNGPVLQGLTLNGPTLVVQGVVLNGPGLVLQGIAFNGPALFSQRSDLYGAGQGVFTYSTRDVPGHSPLSGIASAQVRIALSRR